MIYRSGYRVVDGTALPSGQAEVADVESGDATSGVGSLLPRGIVAVEAVGAVEPDELLAGEGAIVAKAVPSRQLEFARGRSCARRALALLGIGPIPVLSDQDRAPIWPPGVLGSITHCRDYCCAAVGTADRWFALGIDSELLKPIDPGVQQKILRPAERRQLEQHDPSVSWPCVWFSVKEAYYKAWYPRARRWLDFLDVEARLDASSCTFELELLVDAPPGWPRAVAGRYCFDRGRVVAAIVM